jgi:hypothetical protein
MQQGLRMPVPEQGHDARETVCLLIRPAALSWQPVTVDKLTDSSLAVARNAGDAPISGLFPLPWL